MSNWVEGQRTTKTGELTVSQQAALFLETIETRLNKHSTAHECKPFIFEDCAQCGGRECRERLTETMNLKVQIGSVYELLHVSKEEDISAVHAEIVRLRSIIPSTHSREK